MANSLQVQVQNLHKSFGNLEVLKGLDFSSREGEIISILGSSGSGKSTLLRCLNFLETPTKGSVEVLGQEFLFPGKQESKKMTNLRRKVAMVFQQFHLWPHRSVIENVMEAPIHVHGVDKKEAEERAKKYLEKVGVLEKANDYPSSLSGGQKQRVAIARALAVEPELLLFDEPTSALDPELVGEVLKVMKDLASEGRSMLIVTHEMNFAKEVSDRIVFLHQGRIEVDASPEVFFEERNNKRLNQFLSNQR